MITAELQGKIGNLMFQIAAIEDMGRRTGLQTAYPNVDANMDALAKPQACSSYFKSREYFNIFKNFDWHKNIGGDTHAVRAVNVPFGYHAITPRNYTRYIGYFQSELYFPNKEFILNLFEPADYIKAQIVKYNDVIGTNKASIHVRRGDYLKLNTIFNIMGMDYYNKAMSHLSQLGVKEYLVFSNDMPWCKENFKGDNFVFIEDDSNVELFLMGRCAHNIISNSSFAWWGAYMNTNPDRCIIAPATWFVSSKHDAKDIVPLSWLKF